LLGGAQTLKYYGIEYVDLVASDDAVLPKTRYVALGASYLNGSTMPLGRVRGKIMPEKERIDFFDAYRGRTPETVIGGSIYVYREEK
jgi:hypothetical protein